MADQFTSRLESVAVHSSGWFRLPSGVEITKLPVWDAGASLFARLGHGPAGEWAKAKGYRLPTQADYDALHKASLYIAPFTLPTSAQLQANAIAPTNTAAIDAFRNANMASLEWCRIHDVEVFRRLAAATWTDQPVSNCGKHWVAGGLIYGWWTKTGMIQNLSAAHKAMPTHTDYATNFHVVRGAAVEPIKSDPPKDNDKPEFIGARNFTSVESRTVDLVVLHSTENPIRRGTARSVALWFAGTSAPQASAHYVVGPDAVVQCVREQDVAWAAPGANRQGIQIEQVGQAARTVWDRDGEGPDDGLPVMRRSAALVRQICDRWRIPLERVDAAGLLAGKRGITTHAAVTQAWRKSSHVDPGCGNDQRWPWELYLSLVRGSNSV
jgi:N-acetyl-anhydromuramyl-L-alanine amidase AmpD